MTDERRYGDEEVRKIFGHAAGAEDTGSHALSPGDGLTLAELQEIGLEVGLAPARIAQAALALDRRPVALPRRTSLGLPISVGRIIDLPRAPTDAEWGMLVAELREVFGARGNVSSRGALREWSNGNLHACVEPTETGFRLRLGTLKGSAVALNRLGIAGFAMAAVFLVALVVRGGLVDDIVAPLVLAALGGAALLSNALGLPRWAREREAQMDHIADRARDLIVPDV